MSAHRWLVVPMLVCGLVSAGEQGASASAPTISPATIGGCHGHANTPHSAKDQYGDDGIGYDGYMDCVGDFGSQRVYVKLQEKDYFGHFYDRTSLACNGATVSSHAYIGRWVSCVQALSGTYRTYFQGTAYPPGVPPETMAATSLSANMCAGYLARVHRSAARS